MARHYTKREKVTTVLAAEMTSNVAAERATGIPESSIRRWRDDPELAIYIDKTRDVMAEEMSGLAALAVQAIQKALRAGEFQPRDLVILLGVAVEKSLLLSGDATSRTETRDISGSIPDIDISAAIREAETLLGTGTRRAPQAVEGSPEG
jgi:hypothetical protein